MLRALRNRLRGLAPPVVLLAVTYYFGWNAVHGKGGLEAQHEQRAALAAAIAQNQAMAAQKAAWQTRIADLNGQSIQRDMLDEQAREVLNLANPQDLVIALKPQGAAE